jgi:hypothetical protein
MKKEEVNNKPIRVKLFETIAQMESFDINGRRDDAHGTIFVIY